MNKAIIILLILLYGIKIQSQTNYTQTIRGTVIDATSKSPITGANIVLLNTNPLIGDVSNTQGEFTIKNVALGKYNISVGFIGYKPVFLRNLSVKSGKELILNIEMEEMVITTEEVIVKAYGRKDKAINEMAKISARSFTVEETERYAGTWFDPARMAANYAGVMAVGDQRNDIIIRGNSPLGLLWQLENINIPNPNHFGTLGTTGGPINILNNNLLDNSDFFTGAFPAEYGNALSGVFDLNMRNGNNKKHEYVLQVGMNGFEIGAEGPFKNSSNSSFIINYRYSTLAIFDALGINFGVSGIPQYQDLSFKINIPGTKLGRFSIFGVGGISFIEILNKDKKENDWSFGHEKLDIKFGSDMGVLGISNLYFFNENSRLKTTIAASIAKSSAKADSAFINLPSFNYYGDKSSEIKYSLSTKYTQKINAKNNYSIGLLIDKFDVSYKDSVLIYDYSYRNLTETNNENIFLIQSFAQFQHKFTDNLTLYTGLHFQDFTLNQSKTIEPRASINWNINTKHSVSAGFGMHSQLQPRLFYFHESLLADSSKIKTNYNLDFSKSNQFIFSYDYLITNNLRLKIESYYQYLYNIPVEKNHSYYSIINYGNEFYNTREDSLTNKGTGKNYGIELTFEKFLSKNYYFLFTASLFDSKYKGSDNIERNTIYNSNFVLNFLSGYTFDIGKYNSLSVDFKVVSAGGKHYIPVNLEQSIIVGQKILDYTKAYEPAYPNYFRIDGRVSFKLNRKKFNTEIAFDLQNLTQHKNILLETYDIESGTIKYDYQLGLFWVFLLRFQF
ncbi:MAG: TonB-dependent receptor [Bacteroidales bacterium]|nr:TonB-dependent receptor [Bacteroidales bacterium]MBN2758467.1 TonB-dependent receptor [Bacteroidales bacterium]